MRKYEKRNYRRKTQKSEKPAKIKIFGKSTTLSSLIEMCLTVDENLSTPQWFSQQLRKLDALDAISAFSGKNVQRRRILETQCLKITKNVAFLIFCQNGPFFGIFDELLSTQNVNVARSERPNLHFVGSAEPMPNRCRTDAEP